MKFWRHRWCGEEMKAIAFLAICQLEADRDARCLLICHAGMHAYVGTSVRRLFQDWELDHLFWAAPSAIWSFRSRYGGGPHFTEGEA